MSLGITQLIGFGASAGITSTATIEFRENKQDTSNATSHTFTSVSFGAAVAGRKLVCAVVTTGVFASPDTVTFGGVSATEAAGFNASTGDGYIGWWEAIVPTGTTGTVVINWPASANRAGIGMFRLIDSSSSFFNNATFQSGSASLFTTSLNIPARGVAMSACIGGAGATQGPFTWAGLTEDWDTDLESGQGEYTGAHAAFATVQSGLTVSATANSGGNRGAIHSISWGPG
jgi:hypothetical protein